MKSKTLAFPLAVLIALPTPVLAGNAPPPAEVILHIDASAVVPPDRAVFLMSLVGKGATEAEARADLAAKQKAFSEEVARRGLGAMAVEYGEVVSDPSKLDPMLVDAAYAGEDAACAAADAIAPRARSAKGNADLQPVAMRVVVTALTTITVNDLSKIDGLRSVGAAIGVQTYPLQREVRFATSNPDAARKKARVQAIAKAKREADDYAASLGYRVVRMTRISNSSPPIAMGDIYGLFGMVDTMPERFMPSYYGATTSVSVSIDFVILPN